MSNTIGWYELPRQVRREVESLAKKGQRHPSTETARIAYDWASVRAGERVTFGIGMVIDTLLGSTAGAGQAVAERRLARKLVALGRP